MMAHRLFPIFVLVIFLFSSPALAQKKKKSEELPADAKAAAMLMSLADKGLVKFWFDDTGFYLLVEPKFWKNMLHVDKELLTRRAMQVSDGLNTHKGHHIRSVLISDMTTQETLAVGFIKGTSPGLIKIYK